MTNKKLREMNEDLDRAQLPRGDMYEPRRESDQGLGSLMGNEAGEADEDSVPGGWAGTDDATSTAVSDLSPAAQRRAERHHNHTELMEQDPDIAIGRAYGGGIGAEDGGITDIKGSPIEESRDWEHNPVEMDERGDQ